MPHRRPHPGSVTGTGHVTVWNVTDPARAARVATLTGLGDYVQAIAFSPRGGLLAVVTYHGTVLVFSLADPARPALAATISGIMAGALSRRAAAASGCPALPAVQPGQPRAGVRPGRRTLTVTEIAGVGGRPGRAASVRP